METRESVVISASVKQIAATFTEWDRRWRADPRGFQSDCERLLKGLSPSDYGEACLPYFLEILSLQ